jgi:hypothetical protein
VDGFQSGSAGAPALVAARERPKLQILQRRSGRIWAPAWKCGLLERRRRDGAVAGGRRDVVAGSAK